MEKTFFPEVHPPKMRHYGFLFLTTFPGETRLGSLLILITHGWGKIGTKFGALFKICTMVGITPHYKMHMKCVLHNKFRMIIFHD